MGDAPKIRLTANQSEARRIVVCLVLFWVSIAVIGFADNGAVAIVILPTILAAVGLLYWTVFKIAARETGRSALALFSPAFSKKGEYWANALDGSRVAFRIVSPRWIAGVARASGWHVPTTITLLVLSLGAPVVSTLWLFTRTT